MSSERVTHLKLELSKDGARSSKIFARSTIIIGRATNTDFQIDDPSISREHLRIEIKEKKIYVTDMGSSNGTLMNHSRLDPKKTVLVPDGAIIRPGSAKIKMTLAIVEVRDLDDVDSELEHITMALEDLAKMGVDKIRSVQDHEATLEKSVRAKQDKLVDLVEKLDVNSTKKEEIDAQLKLSEPRLTKVSTLLQEQEPRLFRFWEVRKKQIRLFNRRKEILFELSDKIAELEINIENHGLTEKRDRLKSEIDRLTESLENLRRTEEKTRSDVESQLRLFEVKKQTEAAELQLVRARLQKEIEEVEGKKSAVSSKLFQLERELGSTVKQLEDVRENLASELMTTERLENQKSSLEVLIEEMQQARDALARSIQSLTAEDGELTSTVKKKRAELKELENFIVNRLAETEEHCKQMEKDAREELDRELSDTADASRRHLEKELADRREAILSELTDHEAKVLEDLRVREEKIVYDLKSREQQVVSELEAREKEILHRVNNLESELDQRSSEFQDRMAKEEAKKRKDLDMSLQELRLRHENEVEERERKSIEKQTRALEKNLRTLTTTALTAAALYIRSTTPNASTLLSSPELEEEVFKALRQSVTPSKTPDGSPIIARAADLNDRERRFWTRVGAGAFAFVAIIVTLIINPRWPSQAVTGLYNIFKNSESSSEYYVRRMEEMRANRPKFLPEQNRTYKETYTDNIIYSEGFLLVKTDPNFQKDWTLKLNQFLIKEFEVDEDVVVKIIPIETRMVNELGDELRKISPNFVDDGIAKMRTIEQSYLIELQAVLGGPQNFKKFWEFQGEYYEEALTKLGERSPAGQ
jgi:hypothetical protein